jgi:signal transduction histidine kinase
MSVSPIAELLALNEPDERLVKSACDIGKASTILALLLVLTTPLGWLIQRPILRPELPTLTGAHVFGAVLMCAMCVTVQLLYGRQFFTALRVVWTIVFIANAIILVEYLTPQELPFAAYIRFLDPADNSSKIAPNSALCMWLLSGGLLLMGSSRDARVRLGQALCLMTVLIASLALIGHSYTIESLYGVETYSELSVPGALGYVALAMGCLLARPEKGIMRIFVTGSAAGVMTRRLYGPVILLPPILGFLSLVSVEVWKWYNLPFGIAVFAVLSILLLAAVVAMTSVRIEEIDIMRANAEEELGHTINALEDSRSQLRELSAHIQEVQEDERLRIAREVHDELGQSLTAIKMDVSLLKNQFPEHSSENGNGFEKRTSSILSLVNSTIKSVQRISAELRPSLLDDLGLAAAIEWQAKQFQERVGVAITVDAQDVAVSREDAIAIFRIYQETLTNITRHAHAQHVDVSLSLTNGEIALEVRDDGVGFDIDDKRETPSLGLIGMRERAALTGGALEIKSAPGSGTSVLLRVPHKEKVAA